MKSISPRVKNTSTRREIVLYATLGSAGLALLPSCRAQNQAELEPLKLEYSEIGNPKNPKRYSKAYTPPSKKFDFQDIDFGGETRRVHYYNPKPTSVSAILLLLHGSNRDGPTMLDMWQAQARRSNTLLIAPTSHDPMQWSFKRDGIDFLRHIITSIKSSANIGDVPIYGFGHSAGAIMLTHLSVRHGDYFKAVAVHAGSPYPEALESYKRHRKPRAPLTHYLGQKDRIFSVENSRAAGDVLSAQGQKTSLVVIKNHNHWYYDLAPFINKKAWAAMTEAS